MMCYIIGMRMLLLILLSVLVIACAQPLKEVAIVPDITTPTPVVSPSTPVTPSATSPLGTPPQRPPQKPPPPSPSNHEAKPPVKPTPTPGQIVSVKAALTNAADPTQPTMVLSFQFFDKDGAPVTFATENGLRVNLQFNPDGPVFNASAKTFANIRIRTNADSLTITRSNVVQFFRDYPYELGFNLKAMPSPYPPQMLQLGLHIEGITGLTILRGIKLS